MGSEADSEEETGGEAMVPRVCIGDRRREGQLGAKEGGKKAHLAVDGLSSEGEKSLKDVTSTTVLDELLVVANEAVGEHSASKVVHGVKEALEDDTSLSISGERNLVARQALQRAPQKQRSVVLLLLLLLAVLADFGVAATALSQSFQLLDLLGDFAEVGLGIRVWLGQSVGVHGSVGARVGRRAELIPRHLALLVSLALGGCVGGTSFSFFLLALHLYSHNPVS